MSVTDIKFFNTPKKIYLHIKNDDPYELGVIESEIVEKSEGISPLKEVSGVINPLKESQMYSLLTSEIIKSLEKLKTEEKMKVEKMISVFMGLCKSLGQQCLIERTKNVVMVSLNKGQLPRLHGKCDIGAVFAK